MTATELSVPAAQQAGASWGISFARVEFAGDVAALDEYRRRRAVDIGACPRDARTAFWTAFDAAHDAEWVRLLETEP